MKPVLLLLGALAFIATAPSQTQAAKPPLPYDAINHHYYTVKINNLDVTSPQEIARHLGVEYVGQVGELKQYHLFSYEKTTHEKRADVGEVFGHQQFNSSSHDIVLQRYQQLKESKAFHRELLQRSYASQLSKRGEAGAGEEQLVSYNFPTDMTLHPLGPIDKQVLRQRVKRELVINVDRRDEHVKGEEQPQDGTAAHFAIKDPGFQYQWHLHNTLQPGNDINVTGVWQQNITGKGSIVAIIDDGLDAESEDLAVNFHAKGSHDFNDNVDIPLPRLWDDNHGTRCAGEIASARNDLCGVGIAWDAKVAGVRILSGPITDVQEAEALNYNYQETQIYSCSWGPTDDGIEMAGPTGLLMDAFVNGVTKGRGGLGSIYVFATGNGGRAGDNCNFDGYTNSRYTISIGAISRENHHPDYSEACSAQLAVTYSSGDFSWIYTCDRGKRNCFEKHSGTSAAAPIAAGIYALVLEANPRLNWRDMQYLTVNTAVVVDENDPDWQETSTGRLFNHKYGYGSLDAYAIVELAKTWASVGPQVAYESPVIQVNGDIPSGTDENTGVTGSIGLPSVFVVTKEALKAVKFGSLEHVTVTVNINHQYRGEVEVELRSPDSIISILAPQRPHDKTTTGFEDWTFTTVKHWEEDPVGPWTLTVYDRINPANTGTFLNWKLGLYGEVENGRAATPPAKPAPTPPPPSAAPTTSAALPTKTEDAGNASAGEGQMTIKISPFIFVMFAGMFVAIGAALFLMYRQRTNPRSVFGSGINDDEEAGQRGGLLGRRGDYEFDELPTHELGDSDDDSDEDERQDPDARRIVFDRSNLVDSDNEGETKEVKASQREVTSPLSSGEEIGRESSFEEAEEEEDDDDDDDDEDDFKDHPGGAGSKVKGDSWDEFSTLVKSKDAR
ncbi:subtilisin-like protein [Linnemannia elongata AG-77]|uniref:Subtilisin-like protein n=1 Tax=Linnemannia elongata AG-77 TaxID=1314771 RepID=A0A197JZL7_9FUNG|nr:subtilisin-like protein [Linnemannia elongata AG-77]